jgi:hypothetical protein
MRVFFLCKFVYLNSLSRFSSYKYVRIRPNGGSISVTACINNNLLPPGDNPIAVNKYIIIIYNFLRLARGSPVLPQPYAL